MTHDPACSQAPCVCKELAIARADERARADILLQDYQDSLTTARFKDIVIACRLLVAVTAKQNTEMIR